jgi:hypothetical protein
VLVRLVVCATALFAFSASGPAVAQSSAPAPPVPTAPSTPRLPNASGTSATDATTAQAGDTLVGTFRLAAGSCAGDVDGSYFRMIQPGGNAQSGPFVQNTDSSCGDKTYTPLAPGTDGGLITGRHQPNPDPPFDNGGGGRAERITRPQEFYGVAFATATNPSDPQTEVEVPAPEVRHASGRLSGDLRAFAASWNNQHFNQGAPKPDGSRPGTTAGPSGTYDPGTGAFVLEWTSLIVGGPFSNFTGQWHLEGTFAPATTASAPPSTAAPPAGATSQEAQPAPAGADATTSAAPGASGGGAGLASTGGGPAAAVGAMALLGSLGCRAARRRLDG